MANRSARRTLAKRAGVQPRELAAATSRTAAPSNRLRPGLWVQPYRAKIPGNSEEEKVRVFFQAVDALFARLPVLRLVFVGVLPHGFSSEFTRAKFELWRDAAAARGMLAGAAFGIGSTANAAIVGARIGLVAATPGCALVQLDAEGQEWEQTAARAAATALCKAIVATPGADRTPLLNQSWPVPTVHSNYPFEEFAVYCWGFSEQRYYNNWKSIHGVKRYRICEAWFCESWGTEERTELAPTMARVLPHCPTIQGYEWADVVPSLVTCLTKYDSVPVSVWSEWFPQESFWEGARCLANLHSLGYAGPCAVWDFQAATVPLRIDGICGPATTLALDEAAAAAA